MVHGFETKVIAITGAASGIGLATAKVLYGFGASLSIADVNEAALNAAKSELEAPNGGSKLIATVLDVRNSQEVEAWIDKTFQQFGKLDGAANLAGVIPKGYPLTDTSDEVWNKIMDVNCKGVFYCLRAQLKGMEKQGYGSIVNAASAAAVRTMPGQAVYSATKAAVISLTKSAAVEVGPAGIRVNAIVPGATDTPLLSRLEEEAGFKTPVEKIPLGRKGGPDEVAKLIAYLLCDDSSYQTGSATAVDGGWTCC